MFLVAELGASHGGSLKRALALVDMAAEAGADAIKLQTFSPDQMAVHYKIKSGAWKGRDLVELYREAHTPKSWHPVLFQRAREKSLVAFSSPFHKHDVDFLETLDCPIYKIASPEIVDLELISLVAQTGKPIIMSTGGASRDEIKQAVKIASRHCDDITLLHCVSQYPAAIEDTNLATMLELQKYSCKVGLSDHSKDSLVAIMAATLGASCIEKHICIDGIGLDSGFAMNFDAFSSFVSGVRQASNAMGKVKFGQASEWRRSLYYARDIAKGEIITRDMLVTKRPAIGLSPAIIDDVIGTMSRGAVKHQPISGNCKATNNTIATK